MSDDIFMKRRVCVLGARSVGKSSLVAQFIQNQFIESYHPTIESTFNKAISLNGAEYSCEIIDTAGQDEFSILNARHAIGTHGYVLVYSVASQTSFEMVKIIYDKIVHFSGLQSVPAVIVGTKTDLARRQVSTQEAQELADKTGCAFVEASARSIVNVDKVFELCLSEIEKRYGLRRRREAADQETGGCCVM